MTVLDDVYRSGKRTWVKSRSTGSKSRVEDGPDPRSDWGPSPHGSGSFPVCRRQTLSVLPPSPCVGPPAPGKTHQSLLVFHSATSLLPLIRRSEIGTGFVHPFVRPFGPIKKT